MVPTLADLLLAAETTFGLHVSLAHSAAARQLVPLVEQGS